MTQHSSSANTELRKQIARIISPKAHFEDIEGVQLSQFQSDRRRVAFEKADAVIAILRHAQRLPTKQFIDAEELPDILNPLALDQLFNRDDLYTARAVFARLTNFGFSFVRTSTVTSTECPAPPTECGRGK